uniref:Si:ch73-314g15.3 n=1 Tax=Salmo trutta TaxID=8032 RepID=A0A673WBT0_SALTR
MDHFEEDLVAALREIVKDGNWQCVGKKCDFDSPCTKLYSEDGEHIVLVHTEDDRFWAMDSSCPQEGGPLDLGNIEDLGDGKRVLVCPWHHFDFCLETGASSMGLQVERDGLQQSLFIPSTDDVEPSPSEDTLCFWATKILCTPDPKEKVAMTLEVQERWNSGEITEVGQATPPVQPSRKENLTVLQPGKIKRGKGGTQASRIAFLHSLANIEQWAIDLSWDVIALAGDEAKHYHLLETRITELDSFFGALPVHNGLWQSATDTSHDLLARLAIVHMVHEARYNPLPLRCPGVCSSVEVLEVIYRDEITHVAAGLRWFTYICSQEERDCLSTFHDLVKQHFKGYLKPPFNTEGRKTAGMTEEWYVPLVKPPS